MNAVQEIAQAVRRLRDVISGLDRPGMAFHDMTELNGWQLWVTRHPGQAPKAAIVGNVQGFKIDIQLIYAGNVTPQAGDLTPTDALLAANILALLDNTCAQMRAFLEREAKSKCG